MTLPTQEPTPAHPGDESLFKFELKDSVIRIGSNLTKREYFAAMAMQALIANPGIQSTLEDYAKFAVMDADALLLELSKVKT